MSAPPSTVFRFGYSRRSVPRDQTTRLLEKLTRTCRLGHDQAACDLARLLRGMLANRPGWPKTLRIEEDNVETLIVAIDQLADEGPLGKELTRLRARAEELTQLL